MPSARLGHLVWHTRLVAVVGALRRPLAMHRKAKATLMVQDFSWTTGWASVSMKETGQEAV